MSGSERQKAAKLLSRPGGWPRREGSTLLGRRAMETVLRREKSASRYSVMGAPREGGVGVLLELHRDLAEGEIRLQREHHVAVVVGQPHARVGPLREDAAAVGDPRADDDRARSEEHTSELQSPDHLVCRLLLEKKKKSKEN